MTYLVFKNDGSIDELNTAAEVTKVAPDQIQRIFRGRDVEFETRSVLAFKKSQADSDEAPVAE